MIMTLSCSRKADVPTPRPPDLPPAALEQLRRIRVFFGHQSVGNNIVAGMKDLFDGQNAPLPVIRETSEPGDFDAAPLLAHARVGENTRPLTKIDEFARIMSSGVGARVDAAFLKFCYIDLTAGDDPEALFARYQSAMDRLESLFPAARFVHFTMPLRVVQSGPRAWVKKIIGRPIGGYADNIARNRYNALVRSAYQGKAPLFDLALLESTAQDGARCTFAVGGATYESLCPEHTADGGHLNPGGRRSVARELLLYLASLPRKSA